MAMTWTEDVWNGWPSGRPRPWEEYPAQAGKHLPDLPYGWSYQRDRYWSCDEHTFDVNDHECYECGHALEPQCEKCDFGKYITTGPWKLVKRGLMDRVLLNQYLPAITAQLNESSFLGTLLQEKIGAQLTLDLEWDGEDEATTETFEEGNMDSYPIRREGTDRTRDKDEEESPESDGGF
jgi:hypothetical protein